MNFCSRSRENLYKQWQIFTMFLRSLKLFPKHLNISLGYTSAPMLKMSWFSSKPIRASLSAKVVLTYYRRHSMKKIDGFFLFLLMQFVTSLKSLEQNFLKSLTRFLQITSYLIVLEQSLVNLNLIALRLRILLLVFFSSSKQAAPQYYRSLLAEPYPS